MKGGNFSEAGKRASKVQARAGKEKRISKLVANGKEKRARNRSFQDHTMEGKKLSSPSH